MRKSRSVSTALVVAVAACFTASCGHSSGRCVDRRTNRVVSTTNCESAYRSGVVGGAYFISYGGKGGSKVGSLVRGGTSVDAGNRGAVTSRGGFGSVGKSSSS